MKKFPDRRPDRTLESKSAPEAAFGSQNGILRCERNEEMGLCADPTCSQPPTPDEIEFVTPDDPQTTLVARFCPRHLKMVQGKLPHAIALIPDRAMLG